MPQRPTFENRVTALEMRWKERLERGSFDHFKTINDNFGHPVGDQVIRSLAWLLKGRLRASDIVGRYGGEEFLLVLRDSSLAVGAGA